MQDDIVFLKSNGEALGSEANFFVKTDVSIESQEAMYYALTDKTALLENVMIDFNGNIDFLDESLCANGRAIIRKDKLRVKIGEQMVGIDYKDINLPSADNLDGLVFVFITRRNTIMPFAEELNPQQGVLAYLWGETVRSFASEPDRAGESVRVVGTDPFIIWSRAKKVNQFSDIVMGLVDRFPGKIKFFQYNTGGVGEIIEKYTEYGVEKRRIVRKATRVPINLMADIQHGDLCNTNRYVEGRFGTREIVEIEGNRFTEYDLQNFYSEQEIENYLQEIVEGRKKFTEEIANEGLRHEIIKAVENSVRLKK